VQLTTSDNVTIGVGLVCVAFSFWFGSPLGALASFVVGGVILIVNQLTQDGLSSRATADLRLRQPDEAIDERPAAPARGPFPPFPLGGSLQKAELFDFLGADDTWRPVHHPIDVGVDWTQFRNVDLFADVTVRGCTCRVGIWDVENSIPVATSDVLAAPRADWNRMPDAPTSAELIRSQFRIPPQVGRKVYRLVVQPGNQGGRADVVWVSGVIAFRSFSLGGSENEWFAPTEGTALADRTPGALEVLIDWALVRDPINTVLADIELFVSCMNPGQRGTGHAMLRDLTDDMMLHTDNIEARGRGLHAYDYPVKRAFRFALPRKFGRHAYVLEVGVSAVGMRATATGYLHFGH
jgi:hypothetical protein